MHDVAQKNCADAEMNNTKVAQFWPKAVRKIGWTPSPARALSGAPSAVFGIAKTTQSSRMYPPMTE